MFEFIGLMTLRLFGLGWLWGKTPDEDIYGNGNPLLFILGLVFPVIVGVALALLLGRDSCITVSW